MSAEVTIERRFRGPPDSANGGYTCGLLAAAVEPGPAVEVTLRLPPPLETPLAIERSDGGARLLDGDRLVAEAVPAAAPELEVPAPVPPGEAEAAKRDSPLWRSHPFAGCLVCGPDRPPQDGLGVVCGPIEERGVVAAPWKTFEWMSAGDGTVRPELVWSVLDCPSGLAGMLDPDLGVTVLGRLTALLRRPAQIDTEYVAIGWPIDREGRKLHAGSAIFDRDGEVIAEARATWIELRDQAPGYGA